MQCIFLWEEKGIYKYRIYQIKCWTVTFMNKNSRLLVCTLWTVCMHMCVHLWIVDMYTCLLIDLLLKHTHLLFTQFFCGHLHSRLMSMQKMFSLWEAHGIGSVALLFLFLFPPPPYAICEGLSWHTIGTSVSHIQCYSAQFVPFICCHYIWVTWAEELVFWKINFWWSFKAQEIT